ncbi:MAG: hypothetical protein WC450_07150 [Candidatus Omnitrophota bacterium]|jgi:hypothetical protein
MAAISDSLLVFLGAILVHWVWCRANRRDCLHIKSFLGIAAAGLAALVLRVDIPAYPAAGGADAAPLWMSAIMVYVLLVPVYLIFYFGTQVESPSRLLTVLLRERGALTFEELTGVMDNDRLIRPRLDDLLKTGYVREERGCFILTGAGLRVARWLELYQKLNGRGWGG